MKTPTRRPLKPTARTVRTTTPRATRPAAFPLDLVMVIQHCHQWDDWVRANILQRFAAADAAARALLDAPYGTHADFADCAAALAADADKDTLARREEARAGLIHYYSQPEWTDMVASPESAADGALDMLAYAQRSAGFRLGLCLGYRLTRAVSGKGE